MNEFDVIHFRQNPKEKSATIQCCELENGNRFVIKRIEVKGTDVFAKLADGTTAKPDAIKSIYQFINPKDAQEFLLNR